MNIPGQNNNQRNIPPGADITKIPKGAPIAVDENFGKPKPPNTLQTFRQYLIKDDESRSYLIPFLQEMAKRKKHPKGAPNWKEFLSFYATNQSMDMSAVTDPKVTAKCADILEKLSDAYLAETTGEE